MIENHALPPALRRPLRFGDLEQIRALRQVESRLDEMARMADAAGVPIERLRSFKILVTAEAVFDVEVLAADAGMAIAQAKEEVEDMSASDLDLDYHFSLCPNGA